MPPVDAEISAVDLRLLSDTVAAHMGLHFPAERSCDLVRGIRSASREFGFDAVEPCIRWLLASPFTQQQIEVLAAHLTVGETYFYRDEATMVALEGHILPELIGKRRGREQRLRIWSAGCCTGEEPYCIATMIDRLIPDRADWDLTILATDINLESLRRAREGIYREWSFRNTPHWMKQQYFRNCDEGLHAISPEIKSMVSFAHLNLAEGSYPSLLTNTNALDLILCRNVLMYFSSALVRQVIGRFHHCLLEGGWLVTTASEASAILYSPLTSVRLTGSTVYQKNGSPSHSGRRPVATSSTGDESPRMRRRVPQQRPSSKAGHRESAPSRTTASKPNGPPTSTVEAGQYEEALSLYMQGAYREAADRLRQFAAADPGAFERDTTKITLLVRACANLGDLEGAQEWCEKAIASDKLSPGLRYLLATILLEQGRGTEARRAMRETLYLDDGFVLAHFALGNLARQEGDTIESRKHLARALAALRRLSPEEIVPESEGMTAGRFAEVIEAMIDEGSIA